MSTGARGYYGGSILSDDFRDAIQRRPRELGGFALRGGVATAAAPLATWSIKDPSLSHATSAHVRNLLGVPGAIAADLLMQLVGVGALALILPVAVWGWRLTTHRPVDRERQRLILWSAGVLAATAFASCLPTGAAWPLPT